MTPQNTIGSPEIAAIIKKHPLTVRRWADSGKLPEPKYIVGRVFLWDRVRMFEALQGLGYQTPNACNDENKEQGA